MNSCAKNNKKSSNILGGGRMKQFLPALAAVSGACSLVAAPAAALELGELTVESKLGQPLRASIAYALQPDEQLHAYCIFLKPGIPGGGLPGVSRARIDVRGNAILLTGSTPIREPMLGLRVSVDCPYTANLLREYTIFVDLNTPASMEQAEQPASASGVLSVPAAEQIEATPERTARVTSRTSAVDQSPVSSNSRYQVRPGDSLSGIVARISDRPRGLWPAVNAIFAANPDAFIDGDVNLIKAGSWLDIPDLYQVLGAADSSAAAGPADDPVTQPLQSATNYDGFESRPVIDDKAGTVDYRESVAGDSRSTAVAGAAIPVSPSELLGDDFDESMSTLRPGDIIVDNDSPFVSDAESRPALSSSATETVVIPDTSVSNAATGPAIEAINSRSVSAGRWTWLAWLGGAGLAVFLGLLFFGRTFRERFGSIPVGALDTASRYRRQGDPDRRSAAPADIDFDLDELPSSTTAMALDADLGLGTGFRGDSDIDVAQDFGFSASDDFASDFDLDLTAAADEPEQQPTDVIPPHRNTVPSILESEIPPSDDDEYDLSMIVDATRQPNVDTHLTAKDLKAVPIGAADDDDDNEDYTLSREVDYKILEQDYQEEFTTTQALNDEIAKAALELAKTMARRNAADETAEMPADLNDTDAADLTAELPASSDKGDAEITAELTANLVGHGDAVNDDLISDLDDTGINEELTAELPNAENDVTVEMDVEGGRIDTKKSRAS
ncbi:MAG: hypothetical protein OEW68_08185 [Gammaproteobacteria bacterium]|nr:hypothetical protein [Gammaproteobacteria bacterium]MDH4314805.1 hypothetical protein [Gammaproteobacteria bacterium]MDH5213080.1 hypothetical protein [Gammaproteobacteria bacterium]